VPGHLAKIFFIFLKKFFTGCRPDSALGKENTKKNKKTLCRVPRGATPGKEIIKKIKKNLCRVPLTWHPAKKL
jgi:hypothetical protein